MTYGSFIVWTHTRIIFHSLYLVIDSGMGSERTLGGIMQALRGSFEVSGRRPPIGLLRPQIGPRRPQTGLGRPQTGPGRPQTSPDRLSASDKSLEA